MDPEGPAVVHVCTAEAADPALAHLHGPERAFAEPFSPLSHGPRAASTNA
ncbi:hypothetical protein ACH4RG_36000 [Streptomyces sp. NPDC021019]